ncbi:hypothetical protein D3C72_679450 [compost metagenome]
MLETGAERRHIPRERCRCPEYFEAVVAGRAAPELLDLLRKGSPGVQFAGLCFKGQTFARLRVKDGGLVGPLIEFEVQGAEFIFPARQLCTEFGQRPGQSVQHLCSFFSIKGWEQGDRALQIFLHRPYTEVLSGVLEEHFHPFARGRTQRVVSKGVTVAEGAGQVEKPFRYPGDAVAIELRRDQAWMIQQIVGHRVNTGIRQIDVTQCRHRVQVRRQAQRVAFQIEQGELRHRGEHRLGDRCQADSAIA